MDNDEAYLNEDSFLEGDFWDGNSYWVVAPHEAATPDENVQGNDR